MFWFFRLGVTEQLMDLHAVNFTKGSVIISLFFYVKQLNQKKKNIVFKKTITQIHWCKTLNLD